MLSVVSGLALTAIAGVFVLLLINVGLLLWATLRARDHQGHDQ